MMEPTVLPARVLIVGGYGAFGLRIAQLLSGDASLELILAGRDARQASDAAQRLGAESSVLDALSATPQALERLSPRIVINASGPFQASTNVLAKSCIATGCHYIDLADARGYVTSITALDEAARQAGVLVVSGASSVPGLSSAVVQAYAHEFETLTSLDIGISPGNSFDPGLGTVESVLGGVGAPMKMKLGGAWRTVYGWQGLRRADFADAGRRFVGYVDVPDLDLFPKHYPTLQTARFQAGLEVGLFHLGLWGVSWLVRCQLLRRPERFAGALLAAKKKLSFLGSDTGGMYVALEGRDHQGKQKRLRWLLVAKSGHGPYIPALASVALARRLASGAEQRRGATPCFGLVTLEDFIRETQGLDIHWICA